MGVLLPLPNICPCSDTISFSFFFFFWLRFSLHFNRKEYPGSACVFSLSYLLKWFLENDLDTPWMHCEKDKDCIYYVGNFFAL